MNTKDLAEALKNDIDKISKENANTIDFVKKSINSMNNLINRIGDSSNLILDPDLDSYYVMDMILIKLPTIIEKSSSLKIEIEKFNQTKEPTLDDKANILIKKGEIAALVDGINASFNSMIKGSPDGSSKINLENDFKILKESMDAFLKQIDVMVKSGNADKENMNNFVKDYQTVMPKYFDFWKNACQELDRLLHKRIDGFYTNMYKTFTLSFILILLCLIASYYIYRSIHYPIHHFVQVINKVQHEQNYSYRLEDVGVGEFALLRNTFNDMLQKVQSANVLDEQKRSIEQQALSEIFEVINDISKGHIKKRIDIHHQEGFIRDVAKGLNSLIDNIESFFSDLAQVMNSMSRYELNETITSEYGGEFNKLQSDINRAIQSIADVIKILTQTTNQVAVTSSETSLAISQISDGAQTQMSAIDSVVSQVSMTADSNHEISLNTENASTMAKESVKIALSGKAKMKMMVDIVNNIAENSAKINKITETIEKIANKTNLLSLNAAIEAARAGEHGKGFAVVADEVGKLASSAADSTQEISMLIHEATEEAYKAVESVNLISQDMEQIQSFIEENDSMLKKISHLVDNQNASLEQIQENMKELQGVANNNAAASEEITSTAVDLAKIADIARKELNKFRT
jgi:methyl-accepting chemotaxis protein